MRFTTSNRLMLNFRDHAVHFRKPDYLVSAALFGLVLLVFWLSPVTQVTDSHYSLLLSDSLLQHRTFTLDHYGIPRHEPQSGVRDDYIANGPMWQLEIVNNHLYYYFPPGSSILSLPFMAGAKLLGFSVVNPDGSYNEQSEIRLQKALAAILMALCVVVIFFTARYLLPLGWSTLIALTAAFGTQIWSTTSRALWSQTWETLLISFAILLLVRSEVCNKRVPAGLLGTLAAWMYLVRPSASIVIIAIAIYLFLKRPSLLIIYLLTGICWLSLFVLYSSFQFGTLLPSYYKPTRLRLDLFTTAFAGNLISPSRGLLIYVPVCLFVALLLIRFWRQVSLRTLTLLAICIIFGHVLLVSSFANRLGDWWAGASYGPRYLAELVPWFALLAMIGIDAMRRPDVRLRPYAVAGSLLLVLSVLVNARGAISEATWKWTQPAKDEHMRALLWDWRHPQFLAGLQPPPKPVQIALIQPDVRLDLRSSEIEKYFWYGWSGAEPNFRWTDGREAAMVFRLNGSGDVTLRIKAAPFTVEGKTNQQHLEILLNDQSIMSGPIAAGPIREIKVLLPLSQLKSENVLTFKLPDAASPSSFGLSADQRLLGLRIESMEFLEDRSAR